MNKLISSKARIFMSLVGPSGSGKTQLIMDMLVNGTFKPEFDKIFYFYQHYQPNYSIMLNSVKNLEFIKCVDFELIQNLPNDGTKYLLIFDDSCAEIFRSREFEKIATSGRHRNFAVIYVKHNLFHKSPLGRDIELQNTHVVLFKSPRDVNQITKFGQQLGLGRHFKNWYSDATAKPYGHLFVDLSPNVADELRFGTDCGTFPSKFYLPPSKARTTVISHNESERLYTEGLPVFSSHSSKEFYL